MSDLKQLGKWLLILGAVILLAIVVFSILPPARSDPVIAPQYRPAVAGAPTVSPVRLENIDGNFIHYNWVEVTGLVVNDDSVSHKVEGYVDFYTGPHGTGTKFDHILFFKDVDAHGSTSFKVTSTDAADYLNMSYKWYIQRVY